MKGIFLSVLLLSASPAIAQMDPGQEPESLQLLLEQQRNLEARLDAGDNLGLTPRQIRQIRQAQEQFFAATQGRGTLGELSIDEKIQVENALERINAEVKNTRTAKDNRNVCWRERVSGTAMKKTRCGTEAERREAREGAQDYLMRPKTCGQDCGGS